MAFFVPKMSKENFYSNQSIKKEPIKKQKFVSNKPKSMIDTISIESASDVVNVHYDRRMYSLQACNLNT